MKKLAGLALLLMLFVSTLPAQKPEISVPLRFDHYYTLDQVYDALRALNKAYPELTTLETVGKSEEGRPIMAMTVNNPKTGAALDKPGMYVDGNIHGNEIQGGEISLYLLDYLLGGYGKNPEVTALVDKTCFYVVPSSMSTDAITSSPTPTTPAPTAACASPPTTIRTASSTRTRPTTSTATATSA